MSVLRPITDAEFAAWSAATIPDYAADKVRSGQWAADTALEQSRAELDELLPEGHRTAGHHFYAILGAAGERVGTLWFAEKDRGAQRIAYIYNIEVDAAHRRQGHAQRAFGALETEAARLGLEGVALHVFGHNAGAYALYQKLGYAATNINMFKPLPVQPPVAG